MAATALTIVVTLYEPEDDLARTRRRACTLALQSWQESLEYSKQLFVHLADDGSPDPQYLQAIRGTLLAPLQFPPWDTVGVSESRQERRGVGASLNRGFEKAFAQGEVAAYFVDDWCLDRWLNITPWVELLEENEDVGMVRISPPHPHLTGHVRMFEQGWALQLDRHHFAFAHRPALYHRRFYEAYGPFAEGVSAHECERLYNENFARRPGPEIVYALPDFFKPQYPYHVGRIEP